MDNFVNHPAAASIVQKKLGHLSEALALQEAIFTAVRAYYDYLDRHGIFCDGDRGPDRRFLAVSTSKAFVSPPHSRSRKFRRRGTRGPVHARHRFITQFRLAAAKVKR
jgi:hypothetical protein